VFNYEMDHLCWRCATEDEYRFILDELKRRKYECELPLDVDSSTGAMARGKDDRADLLIESMIGGRPIASFKLREPLVFEVELTKVLASEKPSDLDQLLYGAGGGGEDIWEREDVKYQVGKGARLPGNNPKLAVEIANDRSQPQSGAGVGGEEGENTRTHRPSIRGQVSVSVIELPCPKRGSKKPYPSGWEHAELACGSAGGFNKFLKHQKVPVAGSFSATRLEDLEEEKKQGLEIEASEEGIVQRARKWDLGGAYKERNRDVALGFEFSDEHGDVRSGCVKFHADPLEKVIKAEKAEGDVESVPADWFSAATS